MEQLEVHEETLSPGILVLSIFWVLGTIIYALFHNGGSFNATILYAGTPLLVASLGMLLLELSQVRHGFFKYFWIVILLVVYIYPLFPSFLRLFDQEVGSGTSLNPHYLPLFAGEIGSFLIAFILSVGFYEIVPLAARRVFLGLIYPLLVLAFLFLAPLYLGR